LFRTTTLPGAIGYLSGMFGGSAGTVSIDTHWWWAVLAFALVHIAMFRRLWHAAFRAAPDWAFAVAYGGGVALVLPWAASGYQPFIYFQF
jgi:hypothetical protein